MATATAHFDLTKAGSNENYNVGLVNSNLDKIDQQMYLNQTSAAKVMVGATPNADGESGRVPQPNAGDEDKYLKADGTWDTPSGGGGGSSTLAGLTDVDLSSLTNGQILKYNSTSQKWENADESGGSQRTYLGQIIPRVSAADSKITASTSNSSFAEWGAFNSTSPSDLRNPSTNSCWLSEPNLANQYIQYHFDALRYFTRIEIVCFSNYSADWVGDIKVEGSNDGSTWENILASGTTYELTAEYQSMTTVVIDLDDTDLWEYIRVTFVDEMSVYYQPSCFIDEIYVYGGAETSGGGSDIVIVSRTDSTTGYAWLIPKDANGNDLSSDDVTILSIIGMADISGSAPPYKCGLNLQIDSTSKKYYCKLFDAQTGTYVSDGVYSVDYTVAYIPNSGGSSGGSSSHAYSTTEQKVGTWIDGSDVWEKTINIEETTIHGNTSFTIDIETNIDILIEYSLMYRDTALQNGRWNPLDNVTDQIGYDMYRNRLYLDSNGTLIGEFAGSSGAVTICGVIRYTKVTTS